MNLLRKRTAILAALAMGLSLAAVGAWAHEREHRNDHEGGGYVVPAEEESSEPAEVTGTACAGIINGLARQTARDEIAAAGLSIRGLPARMVKQNEIATWTCLSDGMKDVVDALLVEFNDTSGNWLATIAILPPGPPSDTSEWADYLTFATERPSGIVTTGDGFVALSVDDARGRDVAELMRQPRAERVGAWRALIDALAARP